MSDKNAKGADKMSDMPVSSDKAEEVKGGITPKGGFINFGDIKGESTDKDHKDWIV